MTALTQSPAKPLVTLTDAQRDDLVATIERDGVAVIQRFH